MAHGEFNQILGSINALSPEQMIRLRRELDAKLAGSETTSPAQASTAAEPNTATEESSAPLPAWKRLLENMKDVPDEVFDRIPADSSAQLDHYLYGTPKRPTA